MARNVQLQHLRGSQANMPTLADGEFYYTTDTRKLWVGTSSGTNLLLTPDAPQEPLPVPSLPVPDLRLPTL